MLGDRRGSAATTARELPAGEVGTVYFERDERRSATTTTRRRRAAAQHPEHDSWTTIGDLGYLDEDGYLFLTDRKAFMIISGGVNIYPQEIEDALACTRRSGRRRDRRARRRDGRGVVAVVAARARTPSRAPELAPS